MERITMSIDENLAREFDRVIKERGYTSRSEAMRDLGERLMQEQHRHHQLVVSTMHVHLDHQHCLETVFLKGPASAVRAFADGTQAERGVRHASINVIAGDSHHHAISDHHHSGHPHLIPRS